MKNFYYFLFFFNFCFISLFSSPFKQLENFNYQNYTDCKQNAIAREVAEKYGLQISGSGGGFRAFVENISIEYTSYEHLSVDQVRELFISANEMLLAEFNNDKLLRPYLRRFPCPVDNIRIGIMFIDKKTNRFVDNRFVASVGIARGNIYYSAFDPLKNALINLHREPYEEALRIIRERNGGEL